jgi:hypothetical protein
MTPYPSGPMPEYEGFIPPLPSVKEQVESLQRLVLEGITVFQPHPIKGTTHKMRQEAAWMIAAHLYVNGVRVEQKPKRAGRQPLRRTDAAR